MTNINYISPSDIKAEGAKCSKSDIIMATTDGPTGRVKPTYTNVFGETFTADSEAYYLGGYEDPETVTIKVTESGKWYALHKDGARGGLENSLYIASKERFERQLAKWRKGGAR